VPVEVGCDKILPIEMEVRSSLAFRESSSWCCAHLCGGIRFVKGAQGHLQRGLSPAAGVEIKGVGYRGWRGLTVRRDYEARAACGSEA
jgi:hypothetical protein